MFELRLPNCPYCRASTTGDCGNHGPKGTIAKAQEDGDLGTGRVSDRQEPYGCPVCRGSGQVRHDFYDATPDGREVATPVPCRSCKGEGVLWR